MTAKSRWWVEDGTGGVRPAECLEAAPHVGTEVGYDEVGPYTVSTVFLALDQRGRHPDPNVAPVLYETFVRGPAPLGEQAERYATREEAGEGHREWVERCRSETAG